MDRYWVSRVGLKEVGGDPKQFSTYFPFCRVLPRDPMYQDRIWIDHLSASLLSEYCHEHKVALKVYSCDPADECMFKANQEMLDSTLAGWKQEMGFDETQTQATQEDATPV